MAVGLDRDKDPQSASAKTYCRTPKRLNLHHQITSLQAIAKQSRGKKFWIASTYAQERFGGLLPRVACAASEEGSSLTLLAMTGQRKAR